MAARCCAKRAARNITWFIADDESIKTADDLNLRLDRIVRSFPQ